MVAVTNPRAKSTRREPVPSHTKALVLLECGYMCANPRCRHVLTLELHHIHWVRDGGGNSASNLLALCPNCHALHTQGKIPHQAVRVWKGMVQSVNNTNRDNVDIILHLEKMEKSNIGRSIRYSGESLLRLAGLLNSGVVEILSGQAASGTGGSPPFSAFEIKLTPLGCSLVEAWLQGDERLYLKAMRGLTARSSRRGKGR